MINLRRNRDLYIKAKVSFVELLDLFPNAAAGYSLRKLRSGYTGAAIKVRRSSDNAEQDIFFDNNVIDTAALLSFVGSGDGFVSVWYDQSGNNNDVAQTSAGSQPRIVNSGVVEVENGEPALNWYGTTQFFDGGNILGLDNQSLQIYNVSKSTPQSSSVMLVSKSIFRGAANRYGLFSQPNLNYEFFIRNNLNTGGYNVVTTGAQNQQRLLSCEYTVGNEIRLNVDTNTNTRSTPLSSVQNVNRRFLIGATNNANNNGETRYHMGTMQEVILYIKPTADLPTLSRVNTNINNYYNVY